mmetsp:Transcript_3716/g.5525  ORF Transcript_3716/g.5525 Transcript_3716/m.5525 type:complete len:147 (-) Transcript_3716:138-578(-)
MSDEGKQRQIPSIIKRKWKNDWAKLYYIDGPVIIIMIVSAHILAGAVGFWAEQCLSIPLALFTNLVVHKLVLPEAFPWYYPYAFSMLSIVSVACELGFQFMNPTDKSLVAAFIVLIVLRTLTVTTIVIFLPWRYVYRHFGTSINIL